MCQYRSHPIEGEPETAMRYEKADNVMQLALEMQAARGGLSLDDIASKFSVGRRTAMRMRDAVLRSFPQAEELPPTDRVKRWRLPPGTLDRLVNFTADELAALETATRLLEAENRADIAAELATLSAKVKALLKPDIARRVEPDIETLLESEGLAMRPGPRPKIAIEAVESLRHAIKACRKVRIAYRNRKTGQVNQRLVHPYGFLHGHRHYLVGWHEHPKANGMRLFSLPQMESVEITEQAFLRLPDFSLAEFAARSFGVFQDEAPTDVVWRFLPEAAADAAGFVFHPGQRLEWQSDGALLVRFRAGSDLEMAWHLYCWGDKVEVLQPQRLADLVRNHRVAWPALP